MTIISFGTLSNFIKLLSIRYSLLTLISITIKKIIYTLNLFYYGSLLSRPLQIVENICSYRKKAGDTVHKLHFDGFVIQNKPILYCKASS